MTDENVEDAIPLNRSYFVGPYVAHSHVITRHSLENFNQQVCIVDTKEIIRSNDLFGLEALEAILDFFSKHQSMTLYLKFGTHEVWTLSHFSINGENRNIDHFSQAYKALKFMKHRKPYSLGLNDRRTILKNRYPGHYLRVV